MNGLLTASLAALFLTVSASEDAPPRITELGPIAPDILVVTVETGQTEYGKQVPYVPEEADRIEEDHNKTRWIVRDGKTIGSLVGKDGKIMFTFDRLWGAPLDTSLADSPSTYLLSSKDDEHYAAARSPQAVYRKTKPTDLLRTSRETMLPTLRHILYLRLPEPLERGAAYTLRFEDTVLPEQHFVFEPREMRSEAVHVSFVGFRPQDPAKVAFLSCWMGSGGPKDYAAGMAFQVLDDATGDSVFDGVTVLTKAKDEADEDALNKNYNRTDVYMMDFTPLEKPGVYRVYVENVGTSYPFTIAEDVWREAFTISARGYYHQRSGIELGPPYSEYARPRPFHPDDGTVVYASTTPIVVTGNGVDFSKGNFDALVAGKTDEVVPNVWGGYMDAGDFDRRIQHLDASRVLLELALLFPDYFKSLDLNIPESGNELPDIVDEALFGLDVYRRLQTEEGGVRGGIESEEHPRYGETSWQESLTVYAYAPDTWSTYQYAGVAARAAWWFETHAKSDARGGLYRESATRAMDWAEKKMAAGDYEKEYEYVGNGINDYRNLAAAELFRLTGDAQWHQAFLETSFLKEAGAAAVGQQGDKQYSQDHAAFVYAQTARPEVDKSIQENCRQALVTMADSLLEAQYKAGYRWIKTPSRPSIATLGTSLETANYVLRAHQLTGDEKYLIAAVLTSQTHTGANPLNMSYTTGIGPNYPRHVLHVEHRITHQPIFAGITIVGSMDWEPLGGMAGLYETSAKQVYPAEREWPIIENYKDTYWNPMSCEYTVHQLMAPTTYVWGYLAASGR